eukprot:1733499-Alexandrium_andersonii.AAC.1
MSAVQPDWAFQLLLRATRRGDDAIAVPQQRSSIVFSFALCYKRENTTRPDTATRFARPNGAIISVVRPCRWPMP